MSDDPFIDPQVTGLVSVTLKAGQYEAPWIVLQPDTIENHLKNTFGYELKPGEVPLVALMEESSAAQAAYMRTYTKAKDNQVPKPGSYGKPAGAEQSSEVDLPFADSGTSTTESKSPTCSHGTRRFVEHGGKKAWICATLNKGEPGQCLPVFV